MQDGYCLSRVARNKGSICGLFAVVSEEKEKERRTQSWNLLSAVLGVFLGRQHRSSNGFSGFLSQTGSGNCAASFHRGIAQINFSCVGLTDAKELFDIAMYHRYLSNTENWQYINVLLVWHFARDEGKQNSVRSSLSSSALAVTLCNTHVPVASVQ